MVGAQWLGCTAIQLACVCVDRGAMWARANPSGQEVWRPKPEVIRGELRGWVGKLAATDITGWTVVTLPSRAAKLLAAECVAKAKREWRVGKNGSRDRAGGGARGCAMPPSTRLSTCVGRAEGKAHRHLPRVQRLKSIPSLVPRYVIDWITISG